jgi:hypothetical protein
MKWVQENCPLRIKKPDFEAFQGRKHQTDFFVNQKLGTTYLAENLANNTKLQHRTPQTWSCPYSSTKHTSS